MPDEQGRLTLDERDTFERLGNIFMPLAASKALVKWPKRDGVARFVHYTSADAALKIITSKRIWMRNTVCMTDFREVSHGYDLLITNKRKLHELRAVLDECLPNAATDGIDAFDRLFPAIRANTYVTSISEHEDSEDAFGRLSMWRAFGNQPSARVAIVFNIPWYSEATRALGIIFSPIAYLSGDGVREELDRVISNVRESAAYLKQLPTQFVTGTLYGMLLSAVTCLKHPGFHEEREWRAIYNPQLPGASAEVLVSIESVGGVPQLVHSLQLDALACPIAADLDFPKIFDRLIIGPSQYAEPMRHAFNTALGTAGVDEPWKRVVLSDIPIRS